jgi:uncharacterized SAM-binding protein YcdF (DUF218 family)
VSWLALLAILLVMALVPVACWVPREQRWKCWSGAVVALVMLVGVAALDDGARKTVQFTLMPAGLAWLLSGGMAIAAFLRRQFYFGGMLLVVFAVLGVGGNQRTSAVLLSNLERRVDAQAPFADERYDVVCVLGGGSNRRFDGLPQLGATGDRLRLGAWLHRQQRTPLLLSTGVFAPDTRLLLGQMGIPAEAVLVEREPENTAQELDLIKRLALQYGWKRIGVVSSAWHLPRVARLAASQGLSILPLPCDWLGAVPPWTGEIVVPKSEGLRLTELALKEHVGLLIGR